MEYRNLELAVTRGITFYTMPGPIIEQPEEETSLGHRVNWARRKMT